MKTLIRASQNETYPGTGDFTFGEAGGFATASFQIVGTFTSGSFTPKVSNDGVNWATTVAYQADGTKKTSITAVGVYRVDMNAFSMVQLTSSSVVGLLKITAQASESTLVVNA